MMKCECAVGNRMRRLKLGLWSAVGLMLALSAPVASQDRQSAAPETPGAIAPDLPATAKQPWQVAMDLVTSANAHAARKDYGRAASDLDRALELDPRSDGAYAARAAIHAEKQEIDKAIADYTRATEINSAAIGLRSRLAGLLIDRGRRSFDQKDYDRAITDSNSALTADPSATQGHGLRGKAHLGKKNYLPAVADLTFAIQAAPKSADLYLSRGRAYDGRDEAQSAVADYSKVIGLEPKMAAAYVLRAAAYARLKDHVRAGADYRAALAIEPNNALAKEGASKVPDSESEKPRPVFSDAPMRVTVVRTAKTDCAPACLEWIAADGRIDADTPALFKKVLKDLGPRKLPVFVNSNGGAVNSGIEIGRMIRAHGLDVFVTGSDIIACEPADKVCKRGPAKAVPKPHLARCASSCAFLLAAGTRRYVGPSSMVGVHQIASYQTRYKVLRQYRIQTKMVDGKRVEIDRELVSEKRVDEEMVRAKTPDSTYARIKSFFTEMGIDDAIMPILISTPNAAMHWLTVTELEVTRLVTDRINGEQFIAGIKTPVWTEADRAALREAIETQKAKSAAAAAAGSKLKPANKP